MYQSSYNLSNKVYVNPGIKNPANHNTYNYLKGAASLAISPDISNNKKIKKNLT